MFQNSFKIHSDFHSMAKVLAKVSVYFVIFLLMTSNVFSKTVDVFHHKLQVQIQSDSSQIDAIDTIARESDSVETLKLYLHKGLAPKLINLNSVNSTLLRLSKVGEISDDVPVEVYQLTWPKNIKEISIKYGGTINHPVDEELSPGTISSLGVTLMGSTYWYPDFQNSFVKFDLSVALDKSWRVISQGETVLETPGKAEWKESSPQQTIFLIAGPFYKYESLGNATSSVGAYVYLRKDEPETAQNYLDLTLSYIQDYEKRLGPYPYRRFSMIENFWETGFGMPSFTLLGSQVLRLPFILYSSYPHEILHNWWGNSVYVDYSLGNWCEGLTTYMADHYWKEVRGQGSTYRRSTLQSFFNYVGENADFPLKDFSERNTHSAKAVGYDKGMMFFHMLRVRLGEDLFYKGFQDFYKKYKFQRASFTDIQKSLESISGLNLNQEFHQWLYRTGAPFLSLKNVSIEENKSKSVDKKLNLPIQLNEFFINFILDQKTPDALPYSLYIPVQVEFTDGSSQKLFVELNQTEQSYRVQVISKTSGSKPLRLKIDPDFDVFRKPYPQEVPTVLSDLYKNSPQETLTVVIPKVHRDEYLKWAQSLQGSLVQFSMKLINEEDLDKSSLDSQKLYLFLGWESLFHDVVAQHLKIFGADLKKGQFQWGQKTAYAKKDSVVLAFPSSDQSEATWFWMGIGQGLLASSLGKSVADGNSSSNINALGTDVLRAKLMHYGSFSLTVFNEKLENQIKEQWPTVTSPLQYKF